MPSPLGPNRASSPLVYDLCAKLEGVSQQPLVARAGLGVQYISAIRCGRRHNPGIQELEALADAAGYDIVLVPKENGR